MKKSTIKERILQILKSEDMNYSKFALKLGVQPSSISHIVSGRNKPSLEFLQKVLRKFPNINPLWLIIGDGEMFVKKEQVQTKIDFDKLNEDGNKQVSLPLYQSSDNNKKNKQQTSLKNSNKKIKSIIVFYTDNTFEKFDNI